MPAITCYVVSWQRTVTGTATNVLDEDHCITRIVSDRVRSAAGNRGFPRSDNSLDLTENFIDLAKFPGTEPEGHRA
jgi:hypothetical protein